MDPYEELVTHPVRWFAVRLAEHAVVILAVLLAASIFALLVNGTERFSGG